MIEEHGELTLGERRNRQSGGVRDRFRSLASNLTSAAGRAQAPVGGAYARGQTREGLPPDDSRQPPAQLIRVSSTRRFCARPAAVLLDATGLLGP
jgi:hypothetical protein